MTAPVRVLESKTLVDLAAVTAGDGVYLVSVENTYEPTPSPVDAPAQKTLWRWWKPGHDGSSFHTVSERTLAMPTAAAVAVTMQKNQIAALAQVNYPQPAYLITWPLTNLAEPEIPAIAPTIVSVRLGATEAAQVHLDMREMWSTIGLPSARWLFGANLSASPKSEGFGVAMNTADAHAIAWHSDGKASPEKPVFFLPNALDPVLQSLQGADYLFFRQTPPGWSVFFHDMRYSGQYGPIPLPLWLAERDSEGKIITRELSTLDGIGNVFAFAVASDGKKLVLSVVGGTKEQPLLRVGISVDRGHSFRIIRTAPLHDIPRRITTAMTSTDVLIGLYYLRSGAYEAEGLLVKLEPAG